MTDASDFAMGATLLQDHSDEITADHAEDGVDSQLARSGWRPVAFLSKALSPQQARQAPTTREFFAMYEAIKKWGHEIANQSEIVVFSDHRPLEALGKQIGLNPMNTGSAAGRTTAWPERSIWLSRARREVKVTPGWQPTWPVYSSWGWRSCSPAYRPRRANARRHRESSKGIRRTMSGDYGLRV